MPPKTEAEDMLYQQPSSSNDSPMQVGHDSTTTTAASSSTVVAPSASASNSRNILPSKDSVPFLKRRQISAAGLSGSLNRVLESSDCIIGIVLALETLEARVTELLAYVQEGLRNVDPPSPLLEACHNSLVSRMPHVLKQCKILVDRIDQSGTDHEKSMIATLRSGFALVAAVQFLDTVQEALYSSSRGAMDDLLKQVLLLAQDGGRVAMSDDASAPTFRISHWLAPALAFDAVCGPKISTHLEGKLPLNLEVEPVISYMADDLLAGGKKKLAFRRCRLDVLECRHRASEFTEGAGGLGVAFVRIQVSPLDDESYPLRIWGEHEVEKLVVKEVRAVQLNAFPPKPRAFLDLYTSSYYGDPSITVTLVIKTSVTDNQEAPKLHVEIFVSGSQ